MIVLLFLMGSYVTFLPYKILGIALPVIYTLRTRPLASLIYTSLIAGLIFDCLCSDLLVGSHALISLVSALIVKRLERLLFSETLLSFGLFALAYSLLFGLMSALFYSFGKNGLHFLPSFAITELILPALVDATFCVVCFALIQSINFLYKRVKRWTQPT